MPNLEHAIKGIEVQQQHREAWQKSDTADTIAAYLKEEVEELIEAIQESHVTGEAFPVGSEIADVLFLVHRLCNELGFDPAQLIEMKTLRNSMKHNDYLTNNGFSPEGARTLIKDFWSNMGSDKAFSWAYLNSLISEDDLTIYESNHERT